MFNSPGRVMLPEHDVRAKRPPDPGGASTHYTRDILTLPKRSNFQALLDLGAESAADAARVAGTAVALK